MVEQSRNVLLRRRHQQRMDVLGDSVVSRAGQMWEELGSWQYTDIDRLANASFELWQAGRGKAIQQATAYNSAAANVGAGYVNPDLVAGVPPLVRDAFTTMWHQLKQGSMWEEAFESGRAQFQAAHLDSFHQAARYSGDVWARGAGFTGGWQRVLNGPSCEWCALVSTQRYKSSASASFGHDNCKCTVEALPADHRGQTVNRQLLDRLEVETNIQRRLAVAREPERLFNAADNAQRRSVEWRNKAFATDSSGEKYEIYLDRAVQWDRKAQEYRVRATKLTVGADRPSSSTGYVNPDGTPAPRPVAATGT